MTKEKWINLLGNEFYHLFKDYLHSVEMDNLLIELYKLYNNKKVYPSPNNVFRCFKETPISLLKVVILGQDPYFNGRATGIAFANDENVLDISPSLLQIKNSVEYSVYNGLLIEFDTTLLSWSKQGVLLLNSALTVEEFKPKSHSFLWKNFIKYVIKTINDNFTGIHFAFWGADAKSFIPEVNNKLHFIYQHTHPSYAVRNNVDWNCTHFKDINNNIILQNGKEEIVRW